MAAEARRIRDEPSRADAVAEEEPAAAVPGMAEIPDLVAPHDDAVEALQLGRVLEREPARERQRREGVEELADLVAVERAVGHGHHHRLEWAEGAPPLGDVDAAGVVVEQHRVVAACAKPLDEGACLPVRAVVDAAVEGEDADLHEATAAPIRRWSSA